MFFGPLYPLCSNKRTHPCHVFGHYSWSVESLLQYNSFIKAARKLINAAAGRSVHAVVEAKCQPAAN